MLAVVLIIAVSLRSWRRVLAVCEPLALAVLLTVGILALMKVQLGILHYLQEGGYDKHLRVLRATLSAQ